MYFYFCEENEFFHHVHGVLTGLKVIFQACRMTDRDTGGYGTKLRGLGTGFLISSSRG